MPDTGSGNAGNQKKICVACSKEYIGELTVCPADGTTLTPLKETDLVGSVLGDRYEILELIGDGAMGQVYKAKHRLLKRIVAVKMMHPNLVSGAAALKRFQKEAEMASALNHPNILTVYDFGVTDGGVPYLVMAFLEGTSLAEQIAGGAKLELKRSVHIFKQVSLGLAHAHENGVVHRDLKPSNIMLVQLDHDPDFVKILDFGIAKLLTPTEGETDNLTRTGEVFGSPPYMSPEQCRALPVDARCDIYSLGCVMYRTISGKQPITGHDLIEYLYKHVNETPEAFSIVCPELNIPPDLEAIIFKAMAKQPDDRFQSMGELREALDQAYQGIPGDSLTRTDIPRLEIPVVELNEPEETAPLEVKAAESEPSNLTSSAANSATSNMQTKITANKKVVPIAIGVVAVLAISFALSQSFGGSKGDSEIEKLQLEAQTDYNKGAYALAKQKIRASIKLAEKTNSPKNAGNRYLLGMIQYAQGEYDESQSNLETARSLYSANGNDPQRIAECEAFIGRAETALGQYKDAEKDLRHSLELRTKMGGKNNYAMADSLTGLGYLYMRQGKIQDAIKELKSALDLTEKERGPDSQSTASALNDLGQAYQLANNYKAAEPLYKRALAIRKNKLDGNSPFIADSYNCLGALCASTGRLAEAKLYYEQALAIQQRTLLASDPRLAQTRQQYADLILKMHHR
ncbi:serine/threonine protein kinase [bacterium]|nr:serine/threonine protein kinase [bacterium]